MKIVVIGGVAAGMSAASQAKRRLADAEVIVLEKGPYVSYGACGMPYNIADAGRDIEDLVVISPERFKKERGIDVRTRHAAVGIDPKAKIVRARDVASGLEYELPYDSLVIATGASAVRLPLPGIDSPGVFLLRELTDGATIKAHLAKKPARAAVIIGAGYIGVEMAEALRQRGIEVTVLEKTSQVVPGFEPALAKVVEGELEKNGVQVKTNVGIRAIEPTESGTIVRTDHGDFAADLVIVSVGVRPNVALAKEAGVRIGETGAIAVDERLSTNLPGVFAAGDCAEAPSLVTGKPTWVPLGTTANKQGKIAGGNAAGGKGAFVGIVGTAGFKVFGIEVARTGLGEAEIARLGLDAISAVSVHKSRGHGYPGGTAVTTVLYVERSTARLLGAQMVGEGAAKRIDVLATALHAKMTIDQIEGLDLAYAPPFAPVYDPILVAATVAQKELHQRSKDQR